MFEPIIKHLGDQIALDDDDFDAPVTFSVSGELVTLGQLLDLDHEFGRLGRRIRFVGAADQELPVGMLGIDRDRLPRAVEDLGRDEVRELAIEALRSLPDDLSIGSVSGTMKPAELEAEIKAGTERGERFVRAVRDDAIFVQEAVQAQKVVRRAKGPRVRPAFDF